MLKFELASWESVSRSRGLRIAWDQIMWRSSRGSFGKLVNVRVGCLRIRLGSGLRMVCEDEVFSWLID